MVSGRFGSPTKTRATTDTLPPANAMNAGWHGEVSERFAALLPKYDVKDDPDPKHQPPSSRDPRRYTVTF
jgi:hypothetical protein